MFLFYFVGILLMKKVEAVVRSEKFPDVKESLDKIGIKGFLTYEVKGRGQQKGFLYLGEGKEGSLILGGLIPKTKIEIVCDDAEVEKIISAISSSAKTGAVGDGKIFVYDVSEVIRVRTGERGNAAI